MSKRNATASWSGYSHQGKVGIYIALRTINDLEEEINGDLILDYERQEDVRLKRNGQTLQVHQIKAYRGKNTYGSYTDALKGFETCNGSNYLHTIENIRNWDQLTDEQNPENIERYQYRNGNFHSGLNEISDMIIEEIQILLRSNEHAEAQNQGYSIVIKNNLLGELDHVLRLAHHSGDNHPHFSLDRINEIVTLDPDLYRSKLFSLRERFYTVFENYVADVENEGFEIEDHQLTKLREIIEVIYCLDDEEFEQFLRNVNPHKTNGKKITDELTTDRYFEETSFSNVFLEVLQDVTKTTLKLGEDSIPNYSKLNHYILTSIDRSNKFTKTVAKGIVENRDIDFSKYESDYIITRENTGKVFGLANRIIDADSSKFFNPKSLEFITKQKAIEDLNK